MLANDPAPLRPLISGLAKLARELHLRDCMSWVVRLLRRWGFVRLADYGLALTPSGELALVDPTRRIRDLGPLMMAPVPVLPGASTTDATPPPPDDDDWDQVVREAKARAGTTWVPRQDAAPAEDDDADWYDLLAAAKARASSLPMPAECAEEDSVTDTAVSLHVPDDDEVTGVDLAAEAAARNAGGDDEITDISPRRRGRPLTRAEQEQIAHEPTLLAPIGLAEEQRRRAAAREARRLSERGERTLTGLVVRPTPPPAPLRRGAIGTQPPDEATGSDRGWHGSEAANDAVPVPARGGTHIGPAPARPVAPLPRLTTRFGKSS